MGPLGHGKSTIVNMLFNNGHGVGDCTQPEEVGSGPGSCTQKAAVLLAPRQGLLLCDSRGLNDPNMTNMDVFHQVQSIFKELGEGPTTLIAVARFGGWTTEVLQDMALFDKFFSPIWRSQSILVLTHYRGQWQNGLSDILALCSRDDDSYMTKVVQSFAHVIVTDNCIQPGVEEWTRDARRQCLQQLNKTIRAWSRPIPLARKSSYGNFIDGVLGLLRPAPIMPCVFLGSVQESPPGIVARQTDLTDRLTAVESRLDQPSDLIQERERRGYLVRSGERTGLRTRLEAPEQNCLSTRTDAPVPMSQTSDTWRLGQPHGAGQSTVQHAGDAADVFESPAYKKVRMRLIRALDVSEVRIMAEGCSLIRSTQVDRLSRVFPDRLDHNRELFRIMEVGGKQALKTFSQHVLAEMGDHYRDDRATLDNLLS